MRATPADTISNLLAGAEVVFWDFDGVIKESNEAKGDTFQDLFSTFGKEIADRVRRHHDENTGVSRYKKIPLYLEWSGIEPTDEVVDEYARAFASQVCGKVVSSPWVPGVINYIEKHHEQQKMIILTATPQQEIQQIVARLGVEKFFFDIAGYPESKMAGIRRILATTGIKPEDALIVGDSIGDYEAARTTGVPFILRLTRENRPMFGTYNGHSFEQLNEE